MNLVMREAAIKRPRDVEVHGPEAFAAMRKAGVKVKTVAELIDKLKNEAGAI